ncbi:NAD(P)-binding protein [Halarcobacter ebronensis]|nr:NAD(P)-binding protein [Halarcobacter ebronensis]
MKQVIIIGAGPTGLLSAYELIKSKKFKVVLLEKSEETGGYGKSLTWNKDILDIGPHTLHAKGGEIEDLVKKLYENESEQLISGRKKVSVYLNNKFFKYPLQIKEALLKFNLLTSFIIIFEFILTSLFHSIVSIPITNFEEWGKKRFGSKLYQISFGDYTEKVWKISPENISSKFASEKIQGFSFINLIRKLLKIGGQVTEPYYQEWLYTKRGSGDIFRKITKNLSESDLCNIYYNTTNIDIDYTLKKMIVNEKINLEYDILINTIPLPTFMDMNKSKLPYEVKYHANKLKYNSLLLVYLKIDLEKITDYTWFYLLEKKFKVNRITEQKNLTHHTISSSNETILTLEYTYNDKSLYKDMSDKEIYELAINDIKNINKLSDIVDHIVDYRVEKFDFAYEIYDIDFDKHAEYVITFIRNEMNSVYTVGRRGMFLQGDMYSSMQCGLEISKLINLEENMNKDKINNFYSKYLRYL